MAFKLIIHAIIRVRQRIRSQQHVGRLSTDDFFLLCWEINLSQGQFYFPLITNSNSRRKTGHFFLFPVTNLIAFGNFAESDASDEFLLSTIAIQKLRFNCF